MSSNTRRLERSRLSAAMFAALLMPAAGVAMAQDAAQAAPAQPTADQSGKATSLDKIVVTGSLIPQTEIETFTPVTIITAEDLQTRGFTSVADALQQSSFATGGVQGNQTSASFTQGAETNSLFGLNPGYTKYLIDGRPMANYPALYNGTDVFNNISGIPIDLVDRIEILPGGQSSLYGSDAIAGVINVILKKHVDGTIVSARVGAYTDGGGDDKRFSLSTSFSSADGRFNSLVGVQYEKVNPIWAYDRDLTKQFNLNGHTFGGNPSPPVASRDVLIFGYYSGYIFADPNSCAGVSSGFGGTEGRQHRASQAADYCGSFFTPGYRTLKNGKEGGQFYTHSTFDLNDNVQLYADVLYNKERTSYHIGSGFTWWGSSVKWGYFYDPNLNDYIQLQRAFMPEDMGGWSNSMDHNDSESYAVTFGANGRIGSSNWDYDVGATRTEYRLTEHSFARLADPINDWFEQNIMGPQLGTTPSGYAVYTPDYAAFYQLIPVDAFNSFTTHTTSKSKTYDNMIRGQVTNSSLFSLPGGDAGVAFAIEGGSEGWDYSPDARLVPDPVTLESEIWGTTSVTGHGSRTRYAVTGEMRMPIWEPLTVSLSGRYDSFTAGGKTISKPTYAMGLEYRPFESLLFRGKYGTAFKAPTLADQFQGVSGFYSTTTDYLACNRAGFGPDNIDNCPPLTLNQQFFGQSSGNVNLEPITADVWSYGVVWAPTPKFSIGADYHHWDIVNEVAQQDIDRLMQDELNCTSVADGGTGALDPSSPDCQVAFDQITRNNFGTLQSIYVTKINVAKEVLNAVTLDLHYLQSLGNFGDIKLNGSWTRNLKHEQQTYPYSDVINLLDNGFYSRDPHYKANASLAWSKDRWTTTLYANYVGPTANNAAWSQLGGFNAPGGGYLGSYTLYNGSVNFDVTPDLQLSFLVTNIFNRMPDMDWTYPGTSGAPYNSDTFDAYGRAWYLEARWNFGKSQ